jgi:adenylate cyclase
VAPPWTPLRRLRGSPWPRYAVAMALSNVAGALVVFVFVRFVLPVPRTEGLTQAEARNVVVFGIVLVVAVVTGTASAALLLRPVLTWRRRGGAPTRAEQRAALRAPLRQVGVHAAMWTLGGVIFVGLNVGAVPRLAVAIAVTVLLGAAATCSLGYLLAERLLRPVAAAALAHDVPEQTTAPGVVTRVLIAVGAAAGIPALGIVLVVVSQLTGQLSTTTDGLALTVLFLAVVLLVVGLLGSLLVARSVADPVQQVRRALAQVQRGRTDVSVEVYDGSEVGLLQAGFNQMVGGVAERERLRDLFGRHVGEDVARRALEHGTDLGGEVRDVAVLFVDLVGSTHLAATRPPAEVVVLLNDFFRVVVEVVGRHGGFVNKFEGDAALVVFGAPLEHPGASAAALRAARELRAELRAVSEVDFGIGVSSGAAVAGNIGAARRFEYTVIGDPVNEAARLTELAKTRPGRVLASLTSLERAGDPERHRWEQGAEVELRGRASTTRLAEPTT